MIIRERWNRSRFQILIISPKRPICSRTWILGISHVWITPLSTSSKWWEVMGVESTKNDLATRCNQFQVVEFKSSDRPWCKDTTRLALRQALHLSLQTSAWLLMTSGHWQGEPLILQSRQRGETKQPHWKKWALVEAQDRAIATGTTEWMLTSNH